MPTAGAAPTDMIGNRNVTDVPPAQRGTAMMFQDYALFPHLNVVDNVAFAMLIRGRPNPERRARAHELLELAASADRS
jgi:putative spermidine/putrescine transport system ATP-binding protein